MRRALLRVLEYVDEGEIRLHEGGRVHVFGRTTERFPDPVEVRVLAPSFWRTIALGGTVGSGEAWIDGDWTASDLTSLIRIILANDTMRGALEGGAARLATPARRLLHGLRRNHRRGSRRNIAAHYDLGNDFFEAFLDPTMTYSSGVFPSPEASMEEASIHKYERLCKAIDLRPGDRLLEIGTGWGGFAIHAARTRGCHVTTTTVSRAQHDGARARIREAGLEDRIELLLEDYRDLRGQYDKLVSIEMIEAVGHQYLPTFFRVCDERLVDQGRMALQCITIADDAYERATRTVDFIKRYVFPGGCLPSLRVIDELCERETRLVASEREEITAHYAETLRRWRARLAGSAEALRARGYDDALLRLWEFYFCYCEAGFVSRHIGTWQLVLEKSAVRGARGDARLG
ncbi:MAG: class I SAM-dependent methyltransferase [Spirochaetaceae bacterium]|nr:class I SAM-dependent methyltransferase [Myxococcales bacterium]MCB9726136.1 class I SAM-dependent methyltransferase [Spirochaetaceae bacterium]HPG24457.1 cyclopropane-fatty-acyl-phospholipid synthase family protein [Myxococcota bacterium]